MGLAAAHAVHKYMLPGIWPFYFQQVQMRVSLQGLAMMTQCLPLPQFKHSSALLLIITITQHAVHDI